MEYNVSRNQIGTGPNTTLASDMGKELHPIILIMLAIHGGKVIREIEINSRYLRNTKTLLKTAGKREYQQQYKEFIEAEMVLTPQGYTENSLISPSRYETTKDPSIRKPLCQFLEALDVKHNTALCRLGVAKSKIKTIRAGNMLWSNIAQRRGHTQIN